MILNYYPKIEIEYLYEYESAFVSRSATTSNNSRALNKVYPVQHKAFFSLVFFRNYRELLLNINNRYDKFRI